MVELFPQKRIEKIIEIRDASKTDTQLRTRAAIVERLARCIDTATDDEHFYALVWNDFPVWCVAFIDDDSGNPLFPAKWQNEYANLLDRKKYVWALCSRKVGKSTLLALKNLHDLCGELPKRIINFAPTMKQDFVYQKTAIYLEKSPYLYDIFAGEGSVTKDYIHLSNGSSCINKTIGLATKGELARGEYGDCVTVDEVQKVEAQVMRQIIRPIIADAYSEKKFRIIGTPNLFANPSLDAEWREWIKKSQQTSEYGYMQVDWVRGVREGCLDEKYVVGEKELMTPDEFAMEYEARFPEQSGRFFPTGLLDECLDPEGKFQTAGEEERIYGLAVDFAVYENRTQIVVGEYDRKKKQLHYVYWKEIDPKREKLNYEIQIDIIKDIFWKFHCRWICPDATSNQDALMRMLLTGSRPIPEGYFYKTKERVGYCASDVLNDQMWKNHKQCMTARKLKVPSEGMTERKFVEKWKKEHNELTVKIIRSGNMIKLEEPPNGYKDLAIACGMLSLIVPAFEKTKPFMGVETW